MSTLTWVLFLMAAIVIGGVLIYNFLTSRKLSGKLAKDVKPPARAVSSPTVHEEKNGEFSMSHSMEEQSFSQESFAAEPSIGVLSQYDLPVQKAFSGNAAAGASTTGFEPSIEPKALGAQAQPNVDVSRHDKDAEHSILASRQEAQDMSGDPIVQQSPNSDIASPLQANSSASAEVLSEKFDYLVEFVLPTAQPGERLIALTAPHRRAGAKPITFEGMLNTGEWVALQPAQHFVALRAGLLMANRHGPLNAMEFSEFNDTLQLLGRQLDCGVASADMPKVLLKAREVDRQCAELDAQLGINILTTSPTSAALFGAVAIEEGLVERGGGRFAGVDASGTTLFTASFGDQSDRLLLLLDVPRAPANERPWHAMLRTANALAKRLDGQLVDDSGKPLPNDIWGQIEEQLRQRYWALEAAGIVPGSARALRLFN
jgi:FtsZ-interacting cell division protein ZipA